MRWVAGAKGGAADGFQASLACSLALQEIIKSRYGAHAIWNVAGCVPSFNGNEAAIAGFTAMRDRILALGARGITVIDAPACIGNVKGNAAWDYLIGYSDDDTHPNYAASEACVPAAKAALRLVLGL